jgi:hypothetical protein
MFTQGPFTVPRTENGTTCPTYYRPRNLPLILFRILFRTSFATMAKQSKRSNLTGEWADVKWAENYAQKNITITVR